MVDTENTNEYISIGLLQDYIELPCDIMYHLVDQELEYAGSVNEFELDIARQEHKDWFFAVSQSKKISSKKLIVIIIIKYRPMLYCYLIIKTRVLVNH